MIEASVDEPLYRLDMECCIGPTDNGLGDCVFIDHCRCFLEVARKR